MSLSEAGRLERIDRYEAWISQFSGAPLWHRPAWLDATVREHTWDVALLARANGIIAALPYVRRQRRAFGVLPYSTLGMPPLTQALGPWWPNAESVGLDERFRRVAELYRLLPNADAYLQNWVPEMETWLPLHWAGYAQSTRYTYRISLTNSPDDVTENLRSSVRNKLRKAENAGVRVARATDIDVSQRLRALTKLTFARQGLRVPYSCDVLDRILRIRGNGISSRVYEGTLHGQTVAMTLVVQAGGASYNLVPGVDAVGRSVGAGQAVLWYAICAEREFGSAIFDFEGSMLEGVERRNRHFGGRPFSYHRIEQFRRRDVRIAVALRGAFSS